MAQGAILSYLLKNWCNPIDTSGKNGNTNVVMAGNRTRVNWLEGSYAHHYTTIAWWKNMNWLLTWQSFPLDVI